MDSFLDIKYKLETSDQFDEYMKALGVNVVVRKAGAAVSPVVELKKSGDNYSFITTSTFKGQTIDFQPGVPFKEETMDGRKVKSVITFDGNKMHQVQTDEKGVKGTIDREFSPDAMKAVLVFDGVTCTRTYKAQ